MVYTTRNKFSKNMIVAQKGGIIFVRHVYIYHDGEPKYMFKLSNEIIDRLS